MPSMFRCFWPSSASASGFSLSQAEIGGIGGSTSPSRQVRSIVGGTLLLIVSALAALKRVSRNVEGLSFPSRLQACEPGDVNVAVGQRDPLAIEFLEFLFARLGAVRRLRGRLHPNDFPDCVLLGDQDNGRCLRLHVKGIVMGSG